VHVSAMSRSFVSDPRSVVKPGDVVRVKVLAVDAVRRRISLTLRLDDEAKKGPRPAGDRDRARDRSARSSADFPRTDGGSRPRPGARGSGGGGAGRSRAPEGDGALADALRRAGLVPNTPNNPKSPDTARGPEASKARGDRR
jgi:protein Tex